MRRLVTLLTLAVAVFFLAPARAQAQGEDLAITAISVNGRIAPKLVTIHTGETSSTKRVSVQIQNRGPVDEVIPDEASLYGMVELHMTSLGACPEPVIERWLAKPIKYPIRVHSKKLLKVYFHATFSCANDPERTLPKSPGHKDFAANAVVTRSALPDGLPDTHPVDDVCPRSVTPPFVLDPNPDGSIADRGCGLKKADKTLGDPILIDVFIQ